MSSRVSVFLSSIWIVVRELLGWEGLSFVVVFPFAVALLAMKTFWAARIFFFISAGVLAVKLISSAEAYLSKPWITSGKVAAVAVAILFLTAMLYWVSKDEARSKKKNDPGEASATQKDLQEIKSLLNRSGAVANRTIYDKNPGFSLQAILRIHDLSANRRKYLFDFGKVGSNRWSIYVDEENVFTFSVIDSQGKSHTVRAPDIPRDEFIYLSCESALRTESTSFRVMVDGRSVGSLDLPSKMDMEPFDPANGVMGANLNGQDGARFDLFEVAVYAATLTTSEVEKLRDQYFKERTVTSFVSFSGTQWMSVNAAKKP